MLSRWQVAVCAVLMLAAATLAWQVQGWRCERLLAESEQLQAQQRVEQAEVLQAQLRREQEQRLGLEARLSDSESRHFQELTDAQRNQARLRDRLATADLRLSVLVERDTACTPVPATTGAGGVDHGAVRARLDPAHARRIIAITDDGDRAMIALRACQAYIRALAP